jgi:hypothetical protein
MIFKFWVRNIYYVQKQIGFATSSSVLLNELVALAVSDKSTVSSKKGKFLMTTFRTVVSSVAKVCSLQNITFTHSIHQCRFPHISISYQSRTIAPRLPRCVPICLSIALILSFNKAIRSRTIRRSSISVSPGPHPDSSFLTF